MTLDERIDETEKALHQFSEVFGRACKLGDGFEAHVMIGRIYQILAEMRELAEETHVSNNNDVNPVVRRDDE